jgi:hypothetical protein
MLPSPLPQTGLLAGLLLLIAAKDVMGKCAVRNCGEAYIEWN